MIIHRHLIHPQYLHATQWRHDSWLPFFASSSFMLAYLLPLMLIYSINLDRRYFLKISDPQLGWIPSVSYPWLSRRPPRTFLYILPHEKGAVWSFNIGFNEILYWELSPIKFTRAFCLSWPYSSRTMIILAILNFKMGNSYHSRPPRICS